METLTDLESFMKNLQILKAEQSLNARIFEPLAEPVQINKWLHQKDHEDKPRATLIF